MLPTCTNQFYFLTMISSIDNKGMILYIGFDHRTFDYVFCKFQPYYDRYTLHKKDKEQKYFDIVPVSLICGIKKGPNIALTQKCA